MCTLNALIPAVKVDVPKLSNHSLTILVQGSPHYTDHHKVMGWRRRNKVAHIFNLYQLLTAVTFPDALVAVGLIEILLR